MKCNCGNSNCRKDITSIQYLPMKIFNNNKACIPKYYKKVYNNFRLSNFESLNGMKKKWIDFIINDFKVL